MVASLRKEDDYRYAQGRVRRMYLIAQGDSIYQSYHCRYAIVIFSNQASSKKKIIDEWKLKISSIASEVVL